MNELSGGVAALSVELTRLVGQGAGRVVMLSGGDGWPASGIFWRPGVIVTAEEALGGEGVIEVSGEGFDRAPATLVGRDPSTDVAVLRCEQKGPAVAASIAPADLSAGALVTTVGRGQQGAVASLGIVAFAGGAWQSMRGGTIDSLIRLDVSLDRRAEGGAVLDARGRLIGMAVFGPRRRVLVIPAPTIERVVDQILAHGRVPRGYLGASLQPVRLLPSSRRKPREAD